MEAFERLGIKENDLTEKFIRGSGPGGQNVNKVATAVYLKHNPSGLEVKAQKARTQGLNRFLARRLLAEKMEEKLNGIKSRKQAEIEKKRRNKQRRTRRTKAKILEDKHKQSEKKSLRQKPAAEE